MKRKDKEAKGLTEEERRDTEQTVEEEKDTSKQIPSLLEVEERQ